MAKDLTIIHSLSEATTLSAVKQFSEITILIGQQASVLLEDSAQFYTYPFQEQLRKSDGDISPSPPRQGQIHIIFDELNRQDVQKLAELQPSVNALTVVLDAVSFFDIVQLIYLLDYWHTTLYSLHLIFRRRDCGPVLTEDSNNLFVPSFRQLAEALSDRAQLKKLSLTIHHYVASTFELPSGLEEFQFYCPISADAAVQSLANCLGDVSCLNRINIRSDFGTVAAYEKIPDPESTTFTTLILTNGRTLSRSLYSGPFHSTIEDLSALFADFHCIVYLKLFTSIEHTWPPLIRAMASLKQLKYLELFINFADRSIRIWPNKVEVSSIVSLTTVQVLVLQVVPRNSRDLEQLQLPVVFPKIRICQLIKEKTSFPGFTDQIQARVPPPAPRRARIAVLAGHLEGADLQQHQAPPPPPEEFDEELPFIGNDGDNNNGFDVPVNQMMMFDIPPNLRQLQQRRPLRVPFLNFEDFRRGPAFQQQFPAAGAAPGPRFPRPPAQPGGIPAAPEPIFPPPRFDNQARDGGVAGLNGLVILQALNPNANPNLDNEMQAEVVRQVLMLRHGMVFPRIQGVRAQDFGDEDDVAPPEGENVEGQAAAAAAPAQDEGGQPQQPQPNAVPAADNPQPLFFRQRARREAVHFVVQNAGVPALRENIDMVVPDFNRMMRDLGHGDPNRPLRQQQPAPGGQPPRPPPPPPNAGIFRQLWDNFRQQRRDRRRDRQANLFVAGEQGIQEPEDGAAVPPGAAGGDGPQGDNPEEIVDPPMDEQSFARLYLGPLKNCTKLEHIYWHEAERGPIVNQYQQWTVGPERFSFTREQL